MAVSTHSIPKAVPERFVSRGGDKLAAALSAFGLNIAGYICADLGSHVGGFVDCLLQLGAGKVYSVDTSYGTLAWKLRKDPRVVVLERTNAMHVSLPEAVDLVTIDAGWTKQSKVLPNVLNFIKPSGSVIALIKPHYEASSELLVEGVLPDEDCRSVLAMVLSEAQACRFVVNAIIASPLRGHGGNQEFFAHLLPSPGEANHPIEPLEVQIECAMRPQLISKAKPNVPDSIHDS